MSERAARLALGLLLAAFVGLGVVYGLAIPPLESPDESSHLTLVRYVSTQRTLPPRVLPGRRAATGADMAWFLTYHDPPLYYAPPLYYGMAALLSGGATMPDLPGMLIPNPSWEVGWSPQRNADPWNKNVYAHPAPKTPFQNATLRAIYLLRAFSLGLGALTVWVTYALARTLWPQGRLLALGAAACVALNPRFIALSAGVTNDNLSNALFSLFLLGAVRRLRRGASWPRWAALGGLAGLALLTKQSALLLLPLGGLAIVWQTVIWQTGVRSARWRKLAADGAAFLGAALALSGWWYARSALLYYDLLGTQTHFTSQVPLAGFGLREVSAVFHTYWGAFGWTLMQMAPAAYAVLGLATAAALLGIVVAVRPGGALWRVAAPTRRGLALLALASLLIGAALVRWALATGAPDGRLLFPSIAATSVLGAWGLSQWAHWRSARWGLVALAAVAAVNAVLVPTLYLQPAFAHPLCSDELPQTARTVDVDVNVALQEGVQLAGYEALGPNSDLQAGESLRLVLYWRADQDLDRRYRSWVQLGPQDATQRVSGEDVWLGGTLYPSELWRAGDTVRQVYDLQVPDWAPAPGLYWVRVGLADVEVDAGQTTPAGDAPVAVLGPWRLPAASPPAPPAQPAHFRLGSGVRLLGYSLDPEDESATLQVTLHWQAQDGTAGPVSYSVFVHTVDAAGHMLGQHDSIPREGQYPTSWWLPGEVIADPHPVRLESAPGEPIRLLVGMYDPETLQRVPVYDGAGQRLPDDAIPLATLCWPAGGDLSFSTEDQGRCASDW